MPKNGCLNISKSVNNFLCLSFDCLPETQTYSYDRCRVYGGRQLRSLVDSWCQDQIAHEVACNQQFPQC